MPELLKISDQLSLPIDCVTETFAFLAKRGAGKTYAASVLVEEMLMAGAQVVVLDCLDVWWGLRSSADGRAPGLPIAIFGGRHGDIPLEPEAGDFMAELVVSEGLSCILVVEQWSKAAQRRFATDFLEGLFQRNSEAMHLVLEEADRWAPQKPLRGEERLLGAAEEIVRRGRSKGIGCSLITQRSAVLHKDVLTQTEAMVAMRTPARHDRDAVKTWFDAHDAEEVSEVMRELPTLATGEAWFSSPYWLRVFEKIKFRQRLTFDSSSTPKVGEARREAKTRADIDLEAVRAQMQETIQRVEENDPAALQRRVSELERELRVAQAATPEPERVEIPVLSEDLILRLEEALEPVAGVLAEVQERLGWQANAEGGVLTMKRTTTIRAPERPPPDEGFGMESEATGRPIPSRPSPMVPEKAPARSAREVVRDWKASGPGQKLPKTEKEILTALAQFPEGRNKSQLTILTGHAYSGSFRNALSSLRTAGFITGGNQEVMEITPAGVKALGPFEPLPTGQALVDYWMQPTRLGKTERAILAYLLRIYPRAVSGPDLAGRLDRGDGSRYDYSGSFRNALSRLRTLELIEGSNSSVRASNYIAP